MGDIVNRPTTRLHPLRPGLHEPAIQEAYYCVFANVLKRRVPEFVAEMDDSKIVHALCLAGAPDGSVYRYAKRMEACGWSGFTDEVVEVLKQAYSVIMEVHREAVVDWATKSRIQSPIKDGNPIRYGNVMGHGYLSKWYTRSAQLLFRDAYCVTKHGDQGGIVVNWEDVMVVDNTS